MSGVVAVLDNPYFAVTDATGSFSLEQVPPGTYTIAAWHERLGEKVQSVTIGASSKKAEANFGFPPGQ